MTRAGTAWTSALRLVIERSCVRLPLAQERMIKGRNDDQPAGSSWWVVIYAGSGPLTGKTRYRRPASRQQRTPQEAACEARAGPLPVQPLAGRLDANPPEQHLPPPRGLVDEVGVDCRLHDVGHLL